MKMLTVFLVIFILGFDFATPQDQIKTLIEKIGEKLEKQNEAILSDIREQLDLRMVLATDFKEQTHLTTAKLDDVYNDIENDSEVLGSVFREKTNLTMEKIYATHQDMKNMIKEQFNKSMDKLDEIQLEIKSLHCSINEKLYFDQESGSCFKYEVLTDRERTWDDAKTECVAKSGALASVHSEEEWTFVKGMIPSGVTGVWLGGSDKATEGTWVWTDGSPEIVQIALKLQVGVKLDYQTEVLYSKVTFTDWYGPNPDGSTRANCLMAYSGYTWQWNDQDCAKTLHAVCKIPA